MTPNAFSFSACPEGVRDGHGFGKKGGGADHYLERLDQRLKLNGWLSKPGQ